MNSGKSLVNPKDTKRKMRIVAFGFNSRGFGCHSTIHGSADNVDIEIVFRSFEDTARLDIFDAVFCCSGIFEHLATTKIEDGFPVGTLHYQDDRSKARFNEIINVLTKKGSWVCALLTDVHTKMIEAGTTRKIEDTDLAKLLLLYFQISVVHTTSALPIVHRQKEFLNWERMNGMAKTLLKGGIPNPTILLECADAAAGIAVDKKGFFLPFHREAFDNYSLPSALLQLTWDILTFQKNNSRDYPDWLRTVCFRKESTLANEIVEMQKKIESASAGVKNFEELKGILTHSGSELVQVAVKVLGDYFGFEVDDSDDGFEDLKIFEGGELVALVEVTGVNGGIPLKKVTQTALQRDEAGYEPDEVPALLLANDRMEIPDLEKRLATPVDKKILEYADRLNTKVVRTSVLMKLMLETENLSVDERRAKLLALIGIVRHSKTEHPSSNINHDSLPPP